MYTLSQNLCLNAQHAQTCTSVLMFTLLTTFSLQVNYNMKVFQNKPKLEYTTGIQTQTVNTVQWNLLLHSQDHPPNKVQVTKK